MPASTFPGVLMLRFASLVSLTVWAATPPATTPESDGTGSAWNLHGHIPLKDFIVQAHRGAGELAEENTLAAFELGWKLGCVPESDLRTTKDGVIVAFHDGDFSRVVKGIDPKLAKKGVKDVTFDQLSRLDVGAWKADTFVGHHVPRMTEVFARLQDRPERRLYLDIKNVDLKELAAEVTHYKVERQVILASTNYAIIREWKRLVPQSQTLLWIRGTEKELDGRFDELRKAGFKDLTQVQIHVHLKGKPDDIKRTSVDPFEERDAYLRARGDELRSHGILFQTLPYGGSTKDIYWKLLDLGVMSFATDHPDVTLDAVKKYDRVK
jgi:glycerophosphoryl diester phosphodiesterase